MIICHQDFAEYVGKLLRLPGENVLSLQEFLINLQAPDEGERIILVSSTPATEAFRKFASVMEQGNRIWMLVSLDDDSVYCGPKFGPGQDACFDCFRKRKLSHTGFGQQFSLQLSVEQYYARNLADQHEGFPPTLAWPVAAYSAQIWDDDAKGRIIKIPIMDEGLTEGKLIPVHGCPSCRATSEVRSRFTGHLQDLFEEGGLFNGT